MSAEIPDSPILFDPTIYYADVCRADAETKQQDNPASAYARELADYLGAYAAPDSLTAIYTAAQRSCRTAYTIMGLDYEEHHAAVIDAFKARENSDPSWYYTQDRARNHVGELGLHELLQDVSSKVCTTGKYPEQPFAYNIGAIIILQIHEWQQEVQSAAETGHFKALFDAMIDEGEATEDFTGLENNATDISAAYEDKTASPTRNPDDEGSVQLPDKEWALLEAVMGDNPDAPEGAEEASMVVEEVETAAQTVKLLENVKELFRTVQEKCRSGFATDMSTMMIERFGFDSKDTTLTVVCEQARALAFMLSGKSYYDHRYKIDRYHETHAIPEHTWQEQTTMYQMAISGDEVLDGKLRMCLQLIEFNSGNGDREFALAYAVACTTCMQVGIYDTHTALIEEREKQGKKTSQADGANPANQPGTEHDDNSP